MCGKHTFILYEPDWARWKQKESQAKATIFLFSNLATYFIFHLIIQQMFAHTSTNPCHFIFLAE